MERPLPDIEREDLFEPRHRRLQFLLLVPFFPGFLLPCGQEDPRRESVLVLSGLAHPARAPPAVDPLRGEDPYVVRQVTIDSAGKLDPFGVVFEFKRLGNALCSERDHRGQRVDSCVGAGGARPSHFRRVSGVALCDAAGERQRTLEDVFYWRAVKRGWRGVSCFRCGFGCCLCRGCLRGGLPLEAWWGGSGGGRQGKGWRF